MRASKGKSAGIERGVSEHLAGEAPTANIEQPLPSSSSSLTPSSRPKNQQICQVMVCQNHGRDNVGALRRRDLVAGGAVECPDV